MAKKREPEYVEVPLTGRRPVRVVVTERPLIVEFLASEYQLWSGPMELFVYWEMKIRSRADGKKLIRATYYSDRSGGSSKRFDIRSYHLSRGHLLAKDVDLGEAVKQLCDEMAKLECRGEDAKRWSVLYPAILAELPPEDLT